MNPLRLVRTSTFQLAWWYMGMFGASALILIGVVWWATGNYLEEQTNSILEEEGRSLVAEYGQRGLPGLVRAIQQRVSSNPSSPTLYLLANANSQRLAGNMGAWPQNPPDLNGWYNLVKVDPSGRQIPVRGRSFDLLGGARLLVAQDQSRLEATRAFVNQGFLWALGCGLVLALIGGFLMSYSVMRRIEAINRASREIMSGRLQRRMPVRGVNDEFDQLSQNLNAMLDRIDSLIDNVKSVADNIAHDLRTPLTRLRGRLENLSARPEIDEDLRQELGVAIEDADHLLTTFGALLRIARMESGAHVREWEVIQLGPLLNDAWELYQAVGEENDIAVRLGSANGQLRGDRNLLFQALCNLLDNAIKYGKPGTEVVLSATQADDLATISVADSGPGIVAAELDKVLDRFYRSPEVTAVPGSGLGLSLVNAIARHHGGKLVLSDNAPGLRASLELPIISDEQPALADSMALAGVTP